MEQHRIEAFLKALSVNAHSSVRIAAAGKVVYVDPFALKTAPHDADLIFFTHDHFDHCSPEDVARVSRPDTAARTMPARKLRAQLAASPAP